MTASKERTMKTIRWILIAAALCLPACVHHIVVDKLPPVQINANVNLRVQKAVEDLFSYEKPAEGRTTTEKKKSEKPKSEAGSKGEK